MCALYTAYTYSSMCVYREAQFIFPNGLPIRENLHYVHFCHIRQHVGQFDVTMPIFARRDSEMINGNTLKQNLRADTYDAIFECVHFTFNRSVRHTFKIYNRLQNVLFGVFIGFR